eukprot:5513111-Prymnesium_polylepis.1
MERHLIVKRIAHEKAWNAHTRPSSINLSPEPREEFLRCRVAKGQGEIPGSLVPSLGAIPAGMRKQVPSYGAPTWHMLCCAYCCHQKAPVRCGTLEFPRAPARAGPQHGASGAP